MCVHVCICVIYINVCYEELAQMIMGLASLKPAGWAGSLESRGLMERMEFKGSVLEHSLLASGACSFCSSQALIGEHEAHPHIMESNLLPQSSVISVLISSKNIL